MTPVVAYPARRSGACTLRQASEIWSIAGQVRWQILQSAGAISIKVLRSLDRVRVNDRTIEIAWDLDHAVHDENGQSVFGICETDPDSVGTAYVSVNGPLLKNRPDLLLSTAAHELAHVIFDVPETLTGEGVARRFRSVSASSAALHRTEVLSEWRANEFMGGVLAPPFAVHRELLRYARSESLALTRAPHAGRPRWPVVRGDNHPDALAGVMDVVAQEFGVSPRFIEVRLQRYGLISKTGGYP